jgi:hypothetical protein
MVVEESEYEMRQQAEIENASLAESLPNLTWMVLLNKGMLSHETKDEKSKTHPTRHEKSTCSTCAAYPSLSHATY